MVFFGHCALHAVMFSKPMVMAIGMFVAQPVMNKPSVHLPMITSVVKVLLPSIRPVSAGVRQQRRSSPVGHLVERHLSLQMSVMMAVNVVTSVLKQKVAVEVVAVAVVINILQAADYSLVDYRSALIPIPCVRCSSLMVN